MAQLDRQGRIVRVRVAYVGATRAGKTTNLRHIARLYEATQTTRQGVVESMVVLGGRIGHYTLHAEVLAVSTGVEDAKAAQARLVRTADCVVVVCSSTPHGLAMGRDHISELRAAIHAPWGRVPIVLQANKQDEPGALDLARVAASLDLGAKAAVVDARALAGIGVRETFIFALRAAVSGAQRLLADEGPLPGAEESLDAPAASTPELAPEPHVGRTAAPPPLPDGRVETKDLWPPSRRDVLRKLGPLECRPRGDLAGRHGADDGSGSSDVQIFQAGEYCLKTSARRRFPDLSSARAAMTQLVHRKQLLGHIVPDDTVICLRQEVHGAVWLWTISRWVTTLRAAMSRAERRGDEAALGDALGSFATVAVDSMVLNVTRSVVLDVHPSNFGFVGERLFYIDDDIGQGPRNPAIGHALLRRFEEYAGHPRATNQYLSSIQHQIVTRLTPQELADLGVASALESTSARSVVALEARAQLCRMVSRYTAPATG